jgi:hypothetical protein
MFRRFQQIIDACFANSISLESTSSTTMPLEITFDFLSLPPEIRNQIYEECISLARDPDSVGPGCYKFAEIFVSTDGRTLDMANLRPFSLLFANKEIHQELATLVYSKIELFDVAIKMYRSHLLKFCVLVL